MILTIIIAFFSLIVLIILHELGHFVLAKSFGVKVEEFGLGYPPRIFGKKIGETIYSLNLLPFGGFVKIYGHEEPIDRPRSFSTKPFWQKALIILGGVISFWVITVIILTIVMATGAPTAVDDEENQGLIEPKVQIMVVAKGSPAEGAGLKIGDVIKNFVQVKKVQEFIDINKGEETTLTIQRGREIFNVSLVPRFSPPNNEGPMGVALARTALKVYPWYQAPLQGILATGNLTWLIIRSWIMVIKSLFQGQGLPPGVEVGGLPRIFVLFTEVGALGASYFLQFIAVIAVHLALINILPIPALDGGWLMFMIIDRLRKKPLNQKVVQKVSTAFFFLLVGLMIWITIRDIIKLL
ncbi:MAG: hypothetical protein COU42_02070 [Candidatus Nealsonbacteria bacterium CG10_big_fil_rev_8_21_14_0_10_36_24]|uniref:Peptidase M50 domain-containing protein n=2 Tax=Candidatus Nealsoniibacteriota TaxID=1817911 RepID=A0A2M6NRW6_9BACT|nr:MAG: hypothetical protein COU42_02070 [Candidatus Nealsonbacteria bacterium CG10_big_fil_rev_8_21_14_0_10_36_24]